MKNLKWLGICLGILVLASTKTNAQDFRTIRFSGEVVNVSNLNPDQPGDIINGQLINGLVMFDVAAPTPEVPKRPGIVETSYHFLEGHGAQIIVQIGQHVFNTPSIDNLPRNMSFFGGIYHEAHNPHLGRPHCWISFRAINYDQTTGPNASRFHLDFTGDDCDQSQTANLRYPSEMNVSDWDRSRLCLYFENHDSYRKIDINISSLSIEKVETATVNGTIFADYNSNCRDDEASHLGGNIIKFTPGPYYGVSNADGEYSARLPLGDYTAEVQERPLWGFTCVDPAHEISLTVPDESVNPSFAIEPTEYVAALDVSIASGPARPGFQISYTIRLENIGTLPYSGTVQFVHDVLLTNFESNPHADSYGRPYAQWHVDELPVGAVRIIHINMHVPADETLIGSFLCSSVDSELDRKIDDEILRTSADEICTEVRGSYDPNDIQVFSGTTPADGAITQDDKILSYLIRFQNEGNEDAITVRVVDKLSEYHAIESLRFGAASHDFKFNLTNSGVLEWTFNNINLPPKSVNEAASQGYVKFEVRLKDELAVGSEIANSAAIYFDFNSPVITNTVVSRLVNSTTSVTPELDESAASIYPNPSTDKLTVRLQQPGSTTLTLRNTLGQTVLGETINKNVHEMDLRNLAVGSYYLTIENEHGSLVKVVNVAR